jgi:hypothetical protein
VGYAQSALKSSTPLRRAQLAFVHGRREADRFLWGEIMAMKFEIETRQHYTNVGGLGALMFVCGPILSALCYEISNPYEFSGLPKLLFFAGAIANLVGMAFMLVGRTYAHTAIMLPEKQVAMRDDVEWK